MRGSGASTAKGLDLDRKLATGAALLLLVSIAGCGENRIDTEDLEAKLKTHFRKQSGVAAKEIKCPSDIEVKKGKKFDCTLVSPNGDEVKIKVTLTDDKGHFVPVISPDQGG
jgi:hypothetical protein